MGFDADQQAVVDTPDGPRCVIAGPGTGKTTTMVDLVKSLRKKGILCSEIRCVTFSNQAADTIEQRAGIKGIFSTLHSLGLEICSSISHRPIEPEIRHRLMVKLIKKWGLDYKELDLFISKMHREAISPEEILDSGTEDYGYCRAYQEYEREKASQGWMDFDDMISGALKILEDPNARERWSPKYLIVDEAQDTDNAQWRMMQLMAAKHGNITVVGDPNQAIYGFRGAAPDNLTEFTKWFPGGRYNYLGRNYRSTGNIVRFIRENAPKDTPIELLSRMTAARPEMGEPISMKMYLTDEQEAVANIMAARKDPAHSCILARTNRVIGLYERICARHSVKYRLLGDTGFWKQNEVRKAVKELSEHPAGMKTDYALNFVLQKLEAKYATDDRTDRDNDALENLKTLRVYTKDHPTVGDFCAYANRMVHRKNDRGGLTLSTVHQAKGGEWTNVYIAGANAKGFPHPKGDPREEARIYFVAISRPTDFLRLTFSGTPSPYLRKYLTEEILDKLRKAAEEVLNLEEQFSLFGEHK